MLFFLISQKEGSSTSTTATLSSAPENKVSPDEDASQGSFVKSPAMSETSKVVQGTLNTVHQNLFNPGNFFSHYANVCTCVLKLVDLKDFSANFKVSEVVSLSNYRKRLVCGQRSA